MDLSFFSADEGDILAQKNRQSNPFDEGISEFNQKYLSLCERAIDEESTITYQGSITTQNRAALATLSGRIAAKVSAKRVEEIREKGRAESDHRFNGSIGLEFTGSAGQGFAVFQTEGMHLKLWGEANDSVCKAMSGGLTVIQPSRESRFNPSENAIIGNCALYGATGGTRYVHGLAGDRFAVRNSGATAVVEGTGLHPCEYMTNGTVVILGTVSGNVGAGMTGGTLWLRKERLHQINEEYVTPLELTNEDADSLFGLIADYYKETGSETARRYMEDWQNEKVRFVRLISNGVLARQQAAERAAREPEKTEPVKRRGAVRRKR